tara:strand:- start:672 stop:905 length:234 start_codon:yes stop_codon:yes gene_type:complete
MRINNKYTNKTIKEIQDKLDQCIEFENKWGKTTKTQAYIKWCTDEKYRKRVQDFNQSIVRTMKSMNRIELNNIINEN